MRWYKAKPAVYVLHLLEVSNTYVKILLMICFMQKYNYLFCVALLLICPAFGWAQLIQGAPDPMMGTEQEKKPLLVEDWRDFSEGLCAVSIEKGWGFMDTSGNIVIKQ